MLFTWCRKWVNCDWFCDVVGERAWSLTFVGEGVECTLPPLAEVGTVAIDVDGLLLIAAVWEAETLTRFDRDIVTARWFRMGAWPGGGNGNGGPEGYCAGTIGVWNIATKDWNEVLKRFKKEKPNLLNTTVNSRANFWKKRNEEIVSLCLYNSSGTNKNWISEWKLICISIRHIKLEISALSSRTKLGSFLLKANQKSRWSKGWEVTQYASKWVWSCNV